MSKLDVIIIESGFRTHDLNDPVTHPVLAELLQSPFLVVAHIGDDDAKVIGFDGLRGGGVSVHGPMLLPRRGGSRTAS